MDTKHRGQWLCVSLVVALLTGCGSRVVGSGHSVEEERQTPDFMALEVSDSLEATVVVDPAQPQRVRLVGDDNLVAKLRTRVEGGDTLHVDFDSSELFDWSSPNPLRVEVTVPELESLSLSEASMADLSGVITSTAFFLSASGASTVKARGLAIGSLKLELSGASTMNLAGETTRLESELSGASKLQGRELSTQEASLSSSGASSIDLRVSDSLSVTASGGSSLLIIGQPTVRSQDLSGGSTLRFE